MSRHRYCYDPPISNDLDSGYWEEYRYGGELQENWQEGEGEEEELIVDDPEAEENLGSPYLDEAIPSPRQSADPDENINDYDDELLAGAIAAHPEVVDGDEPKPLPPWRQPIPGTQPKPKARKQLTPISKSKALAIQNVPYRKYPTWLLNRLLWKVGLASRWIYLV